MEQSPNVERIAAYLSGSLSPEETAQLEAEAETNPDLMQELKLQLVELEVGKRLHERQLRENMAEWWKESSPQPRIRPLWQRPAILFGMAASLVLLVLAAWFWNPSQSMDQWQLANQYAEGPSQLFPGPLKSTSDPHSPLQQAQAAIQEASFQEAIEILAGYEEEEAQFTRGYAHFQLGLQNQDNEQLQMAGKQFHSVQTYATNRIWRERADWYLALVEIALGRDPAKHLQTIQEAPRHAYASQAMKLLKAYHQ